jgi:pilus assembly protein CpaB
MRRGRILILLGLILAVGTALAVYVIINSMKQQPKVVLEDVVVATQPIAAQEPVEGRIGLQPWPKDYIPQGALRSLDAAAGKLAAGPIPQGTIVQPEMLMSPADLMAMGELGKLVEPGLVAVSFPIDELSSVSYGIQAGDHIDVLMTFYFLDLDQASQSTEPLCPPLCSGPQGQVAAQGAQQRPRLAAQLTLQNIKILGVGRWAYQPQPTAQPQQAAGGQQVQTQPPQYVTLMVTPQDALVLKLAREHGASIDLAVRAQDDAQQFTTQQVTLDYILARFGVSLPAKQPYSIESAQSAGPQPR